jgi:Mg-chelatase subunit ChlI
VLVGIAALGIELEVDGHRSDLVMRKAAQALAAYEGVRAVALAEVEHVAAMVLAHRVKPMPGGGPRAVNVAELMRGAVRAVAG